MGRPLHTSARGTTLLSDVHYWTVSSPIFGNKEYAHSWGENSPQRSLPVRATPQIAPPRLPLTRTTARPPVADSSRSPEPAAVRSDRKKMRQTPRREKKQGTTTENPGLSSDREGMFCVLSATTDCARLDQWRRTRRSRRSREGSPSEGGRYDRTVAMCVLKLRESPSEPKSVVLPHSSLTRSHNFFSCGEWPVRVTAVNKDRIIVDELHRLIVVAHIVYQRAIRRGARHHEAPGPSPDSEAKWANPWQKSSHMPHWEEWGSMVEIVGRFLVAF
jgi:hypothetical protein